MVSSMGTLRLAGEVIRGHGEAPARVAYYISPAGLHGLLNSRGCQSGRPLEDEYQHRRAMLHARQVEAFPTRASKTYSYIEWNHREMARAA